MIHAKALALAGTITLLGTPAAGQTVEEIWREVDLAPGIFALVTTDATSPSSYANAIVISGAESSILIDTQDRPSAARRIAAAVARRGLAPVGWVVNTHWHSDHTIGNQTIADAFPDAVFLAHSVTRDSLANGGEAAIIDQRNRIEGLIGRIEAALEGGEVPADQLDDYRAALDGRRSLVEELAQVTVYIPDVEVDAPLEIQLGGRVVTVIHPGPAHTQGDLVVWDPEARFLAAGDLLEEAPLWLEGADVEGWASALNRLDALNPGVVLPSHGRVREDAALLAAYRATLNRVVRVATMETLGGSAELTAEFSDLEARLEPYGVSIEAYRTFVADAVAKLREAGN